MENPFVFDEMVFDTDYTPEGFAVQTSYRFNDTHTFEANGGVMVLDELGLDSMRGYNGSFPMKVGGAFMHNPAADSETDNVGWNAGVMFGKASKKRTWELSYTYKWLGADAWYEELPDSDFGAFYATTGAPNTGASRAGYASGTNVRGRSRFGGSRAFRLGRHNHHQRLRYPGHPGPEVG